MFNHNIIKRIMKSNIKTIKDLINFWYTNQTFREILEDLDASSDIWLDVIKCDINFTPIANALIYLNERHLINRKDMIEFDIEKRIEYDIKKKCYHNEIPMILINNIQFSKNELTSVLKIAIIEGNYEIACFLVEKGADYDIELSENYSPIVKAFDNEQIEFLVAILDQGYELTINDANNLISLYMHSYSDISKDNMLVMLEILINYGLDISKLNLSILFDEREDNAFIEIINLAKKHNNPFDLAQLHKWGKERMTLLDIVCKTHRIDELKALLDYGIDINDPKISLIGPIHAVMICMNKTDTYIMLDILQKAGAKNIHNDNIE